MADELKKLPQDLQDQLKGKPIHDQAILLIEEAQGCIASVTEMLITIGITTEKFHDGILNGYVMSAHGQLEAATVRIKEWIENTPAELRTKLEAEKRQVLKSLLEEVRHEGPQDSNKQKKT